MCNHPLKNTVLSNKYSPFEKSLQHEVILDCRGCSGKERRKCHAKTQQQTTGLAISPIPYKKLTRIMKASKLSGVAPVIHTGQKLNRYESFRVIHTGKKVNGRPQTKIERIQYGRHKDVVANMIHG